MKKAVVVMIGMAMFAFTSCKKDSVKTIQQVETDMATGTWVITNYNDSGSNETSDYNGYTFQFNSNGTITATNGSNTYSGSWSVSDSNSNDDSQDDVDFNIYFGSPAVLVELNDDWDILSNGSTKLELKDVSGGTGETDLLTFEKQ